MNYTVLAAQWLSDQRDKQAKRQQYAKGFIGSRGYTHLDAPIKLGNHAAIGALVLQMSSAKGIMGWHFRPFITNYERARKYRHPSTLQLGDTNQKHRTHLKSRPIMVASHTDACLFSFLGFILEKPYEAYLRANSLEGKVLAYRSVDGKNNVDFSMRVFNHMEKHDGLTAIFIDIKGFFDNIPHISLFAAVSTVLDVPKLLPELEYVMRNITEYRYLNKEQAVLELKRQGVHYNQRIPNGRSKVLCDMADYNRYLENKRFVKKNVTGRGIPQGSSVSGILANIAMIEFDKFARKRIGRYRHGLYQRYSDDIAFIVPSRYASDVYRDLIAKLSTMGYLISKAKTEAFIRSGTTLTNVTKSYEPSAKDKRQNAQYLGIEWNGLNITLRPGTVAKRFRVYNKLHKKFWRYSKMAAKKTQSSALARQHHRTRKTIKSKQSI